MDDPWATMFTIAGRQYQVVHLRQAVEAGLTARQLRRRVARERWERLHRQVFALPGAPRSHEREVSAALLAVGGKVWASHRTAAVLWGMLDARPRQVELTVHNPRWAPTLDGVKVFRTRTLVPADVITRQRLAITTPSRTAIDCGEVLEVDELRGLLIDSVQRHRLRLADVTKRAALMPCIPGGKKLRQILHELDEEHSDSVFEYRVRRRLAAESWLPAPDPAPVPVKLLNGRTVEVDVGWSERKAGIECQSMAYHAGQRAQDLDHRKRHALEDVGWTIRYLGWQRFQQDWAGFVNDLWRALSGLPAS